MTPLLTTAFLVATGKKEELENISFFGYRYWEHAKKAKTFIPCMY